VKVKHFKALLRLPLAEVVAKADKIRRKYAGRKVALCGIVNAKSGLCSEDCKFCAQSSRHASGADIFPLKQVDELVKAAVEAKKSGVERFGIVTSGNRLTTKELETVKKAISEIKKRTALKVCASLGALKKEELLSLKKAGLSRYHHNIETAPRFYRKVVSSHSFKERLDTVKAAKNAGLEVCAGGIIGMGETWQDRIDMALTLKKLRVDSAPLNFLVPVKGTAMESVKPLSPEEAIRTIAIFRIILKGKTVKMAAGREIVLGDFQGSGFMAGANGMIIGGYLTVKGRSVEADRALARETEKIWKK